MVKAAFAENGVAFISHPWTASSKPAAVETVRRWLRERAIELPAHETMRKELLSFEERITPAGAFTFGARGSGHDDYVALLLTAAMAHEANYMPVPSAPLLPGEAGAEQVAAAWFAKQDEAYERERARETREASEEAREQRWLRGE